MEADIYNNPALTALFIYKTSSINEPDKPNQITTSDNIPD